MPLAVAQELGLPEDIVNVEGGAIAHGHPIGATGAVLITRLLHSMQRDGLRAASSPCASAAARASPWRSNGRRADRPSRLARMSRSSGFRVGQLFRGRVARPEVATAAPSSGRVLRYGLAPRGPPSTVVGDMTQHECPKLGVYLTFET